MSNDDLLKNYVANIEKKLKGGNATEHTYRGILAELLKKVTPGITAVNEPKREAFGAPDYIITRQRPHGALTIGYIEAKDVGKPLSVIEKEEQVRRYMPNLPNFVLTDYIEFRWFVNGERRIVARLAKQQGHSLTFDPAGAAQVKDLLTGFLQRTPEPIRSPKELAERMARLTHLIRDLAFRTLTMAETDAARQVREVVAILQGLHQAFTETLIPDLSVAEFTDMFAQTLAYGLFAARVNHQGEKPFVRRDAAREVPRTNPFLRKLFETLNSTDLDDAPFVGFVDDLAQLLNDADLAAILAQFGKRTRQDDPIVHFYETFLTAYDPKLRELRGVYYTPEPIVGYIVRSVDHLLRKEFGCAEGLATGALPGGGESVIVLDPACGTGTFLYSVIEQIRAPFVNNVGMWSSYVQEKLLPRIFGFELLMAPYAMAHLKLGMQLAAMDMPEADRARWAYQGGERLNVFLTNTLDEARLQSDLLMGRYISDEANEAANVKRSKPVMVVLGNPPYSGHSANKGTWITGLLHGKDAANGDARKTGNYFEVDGQPLGERNPKWLNDDYVKFLRFAQWRIEKTGHGILAFITNNGYLDNPTFRGMRQSLMQTFDDIYILDLHGNSKKKERSPDGSKDENVFDIQQGVAIALFVKRQGTSIKPKTVQHAHLHGPRNSKYAWLAEHGVENTPWQVIAPQAPFYFFVPHNTTYLAEYEQGWRMTDAMAVNVLGFQTHRDQFAIDFDEKVLRHRIEEMRDETIADTEFVRKYGNLIGEWPDVSKSRQTIRLDPNWSSHLIRCLYRPFDRRFCYFRDTVMDRPRRELQDHVAYHDNLCLLTPRQQATMGYKHSWVAKDVANDCVVSTTSREANQVFPLYLYPNLNKPALMESHPPSTAPGGRRPNLSPAFITEFASQLGLAWVTDGKGDRLATFGPEDVFNYMYAVFHAPQYRERYAEHLKTDFPRLPLTNDADLFRALCALGGELVALHLMERNAAHLPDFPVGGDSVVSELRYAEPGQGAEVGRVFINATQYFAGVSPEVWEFHVGGYQVCHKWLKDRKGRTLTYDDLRHYQRVVGALGETIRLMEAIDDAIDERGGWPLMRS